MFIVEVVTSNCTNNGYSYTFVIGKIAYNYSFR